MTILVIETVLSVHNFYQSPGGEDRVFAAESDLLGIHGHRVVEYTAHNDRIGAGAVTGMAAAWNHGAYLRVNAVTQNQKPNVAHLHNTFPLISASVYYALRKTGIPVVQTLSNFRLFCTSSLYVRNGRTCEECTEKRSLLPALKHRCYRNSLPATAAVATMLTIHRAARTYQNMVDVYVALSEFSRRKFIDGGLPADRIIVKPNFVSPDPGPGAGHGGYALYVGRLSEEKGIQTLANAWHTLPDIPLVVAGDGPLAGTPWPANVTQLGHQSRDQVLALMHRASVLVFPSVCYENCPVTILESLACGTPVIASHLGSMPEFVRHHQTGLLFQPGDAEDLAHHVRWAFDHPEQIQAMRANARREFEDKYTAERNYKMLIAIYEQAIESAQRRRREHAAS